MKICSIGCKLHKEDLNKKSISILKKTLKSKKPIELACSKHNQFTTKDIKKMSLFSFDSSKIFYHIDYDIFDINTYINDFNNKTILLDSLIEEIEMAIMLNSGNIILHLEKNVHEKIDLTDFEFFLNKVIMLFKTLYSTFPPSKDLVIYIENTYYSKELYDKLILTLKEHGYNVGFTLDIGNIKIWTNNSLYEWLELSKKFVLKNVPLHFHIHSNNGVEDRHIPFHEAFNNEADFIDIRQNSDNHYSSNTVFYIKNIIEEYSNHKKVSFIFEIDIFKVNKEEVFFCS